MVCVWNYDMLLADRVTSSNFLCVKVPLWGWTVEGEIQPAGRAAGGSQPPRLWSLSAAGYRRGWVSSECWCRIYLQYEWRSHGWSSLWITRNRDSAHSGHSHCLHQDQVHPGMLLNSIVKEFPYAKCSLAVFHSLSFPNYPLIRLLDHIWYLNF